MYGKAVVDICMGVLCFKQVVALSEIVDKVLIGRDISLYDPLVLLTLLALKRK